MSELHPRQAAEITGHLGFLNREIADMHRALDAHRLMRELKKPTDEFTDDYIKFVQVFYGFCRGAETHVYSRDDVRAAFPAITEHRPLSGLFAKDMQALGKALPDTMERFRWVDSFPRAVGVLSLFEGPLFAGLRIRTTLQSSDDWTPERRVFYNCCGGQGFSLFWAQFQKGLNALPFDHREQQKMAGSAVRALHVLHVRLDEAVSPPRPSGADLLR